MLFRSPNRLLLPNLVLRRPDLERRHHDLFDAFKHLRNSHLRLVRYFRLAVHHLDPKLLDGGRGGVLLRTGEERSRVRRISVAVDKGSYALVGKVGGVEEGVDNELLLGKVGGRGVAEEGAVERRRLGRGVGEQL